MKTILIAATLFATVAAPALARDKAATPAGTPAASVQRGDLDLTTDRGAETMLRRLKRTVATVCAVPEIDRPSPALRRQMESCRHDALAAAVFELNAPVVTRLYEAELTTTVASR